MAGRNNSLPALNYGFFVLNISRDLYMAKHRRTDGSGGLAFIIPVPWASGPCSAPATC